MVFALPLRLKCTDTLTYRFLLSLLLILASAGWACRAPRAHENPRPILRPLPDQGEGWVEGTASIVELRVFAGSEREVTRSSPGFAFRLRPPAFRKQSARSSIT